MYKRTINHPSGAVTYSIYQKDEADALNIKYFHWKKAKMGEYLITDDDWVAKVIKRKRYEELGIRGRIADYITTPIGAVIWRIKQKTKKFYKGERKNIHAVSGKQKQFLNAKTGQNRLLAKWFAVSGDFAFSVQMSYGDISAGRGRRLRVMAKTEGFKAMVTEEMRNLLDDNNLGKKETLTYLKEAIEMAKKKDNVPALLRAVENLINLNQMDKPEGASTTLLVSGEQQNIIEDVIRSEEDMGSIPDAEVVEEDDD